jgi:hypothetical protein
MALGKFLLNCQNQIKRTKMSDNELIEMFSQMISLAIDEKGVYPHQMVSRQGEAVRVTALAVDNAGQAINKAWDEINDGADELAIGIDMMTKPDQGTEFADALVLGHFTRQEGKMTTNPECWRIGVINYQNEPRIIRDIDWENSHWDVEFRKLLKRFCMFTVQKANAV